MTSSYCFSLWLCCLSHQFYLFYTDYHPEFKRTSVQMVHKLCSYLVHLRYLQLLGPSETLTHPPPPTLQCPAVDDADKGQSGCRRQFPTQRSGHMTLAGSPRPADEDTMHWMTGDMAPRQHPGQGRLCQSQGHHIEQLVDERIDTSAIDAGQD